MNSQSQEIIIAEIHPVPITPNLDVNLDEPELLNNTTQLPSDLCSVPPSYRDSICYPQNVRLSLLIDAAPPPSYETIYSIPESPFQQQTPSYDQDIPEAPPILESGNPTKRPEENFNPFEDAKRIYNALKFVNPKNDEIISILCQRSIEQRLIIAQEYKKHNGSLIEAMQKKLSGNFKMLMVSLMNPIEMLNIIYLHNALDSSDYDVIADIICTKTNQQIRFLKSLYEITYGQTIESFINFKIKNSHYKKLLVNICAGLRNESYHTNIEQIRSDVIKLHTTNITENELNRIFLEIFTSRSFSHIKRICTEYEKTYQQTIEQRIKKKYFFGAKQGYLVITRYSNNKYEFYARRIHKSMSGIVKNNEQLINIIVTRSEIDLQDIKDMFFLIMKKSLRKWIEDIIIYPSGHYKLALLKLMEPNF